MIAVITSEDVINWNAETSEEKKANEITNLIKTRKGEIPFMRDVGISDEFIDNPITLIKPALINEITELINENTEGVNIQSVEIVDGGNLGDYIVKVVCEIE